LLVGFAFAEHAMLFSMKFLSVLSVLFVVCSGSAQALQPESTSPPQGAERCDAGGRASKLGKPKNLSNEQSLQLLKMSSEFYKLGDFKKAESVLREKIPACDHPPDNQSYEFAECLGQLAATLDHESNSATGPERKNLLEQALQLRIRQAEIEQKLPEEIDFHKGNTSYLLGYALFRTGDSASANARLKQAISAFEKVPPQDSPENFVESYALLAETEANANNFKDAIEDCKTCARLAEILRGVYCQSNLFLYTRLEKLLKKCGAQEAATRLESRAHAIGRAMKLDGEPISKESKEDITVETLLNPKPAL